MKRLKRTLYLAVPILLVLGLFLLKAGWNAKRPSFSEIPPTNEEPHFENAAYTDAARLYIGKAEPLSEPYQALYDSTVMELLKQTLWTERDVYDAGHYLMIPMYQAFWSGNQEEIQAFHRFFERFSADMRGGGYERQEFERLSALNKCHIFYLTTQYANLCAASGFAENIPWNVLSMAYDCAVDTFYVRKANWGRLTNWLVERVAFKRVRKVLNGKTYSRHSYSAITDLETFPLAILCDLRALYAMGALTPDKQMEEAADLAYQIFSSPLINKETSEGGWIFQPGAFSDHSDYAYAGNETIHEEIQPSIREDVAEDSSHFLRMPLFLRSYQAAQTVEERQGLFQTRRRQLANQMANATLKNVNGYWLTTTFMDGTNGVYRYSYHTEGIGYEGYELSGTFLLGWCSLLDDDRITECYREILEKFPMPDKEQNPYFDPVTTREQNPFFDMDTAYDNGMFECMVACAANVGAAQSNGSAKAA